MGLRGKRCLLALLMAALVVWLLFTLSKSFDFGEISRILPTINHLMYLSAFAVYILGTLCIAMRWRVSLSSSGSRVGVFRTWQVVFGSIFITNVTPMTYVAGDPIIRSYLMKKHEGVPMSQSVASIVSEYVLELPITSSLLMLGLLLALFELASWKFAVMAAWAISILVLLLTIVYFFPRRFGERTLSKFACSVCSRFFRRSRSKTMADIRKFYDTGQRIITNRWVALRIFLLSLVFWFINLSRLYLVFRSVNHQPSLITLLLGLTLPAIAGLVPLLPGGLGLFEGTCFFVFVLTGVPPAKAGLVTILDRLITFGFGSVIGAVVLSYMGIKIVWGKRLIKWNKK
jgi:uncharacterized protein (TIRG00374 family)